jgi:Xaa-Pro aminopeptidase
MTTPLPDRIVRLAQGLGEHELDALLITDEINVRYLTGFTGDSSYLLVSSSGVTILSDGRYEAQIASQCPSLECRIRPPSQLLSDLTCDALRELQSREGGAGKVGLEADHLSMSMYRLLVQRCQGVDLVPTSGIVERQRMIKDEQEIETIRDAVRIAERAYLSVLPLLTPRWTERQVAHQLEASMRNLGAEGCSFAPIVAAGAAGALPHYQPSESQIGDAATLLIDWGAKLHGYASDLTRTLHRPPIHRSFESAYQAVLAAQLAAIEAIRPGVAASEVDRAARQVLQRAGLDQSFKHGLGHGVGLRIHESPRMSSISEETLASGMVITVEPGVYLDGEFGIRIEDDVLVTEAGHQVLSSLPKGLDDCRLIL